ncbi:oxidoreductase, partial [Rhizobium ruizarguesonis]
PFYNQTTAVKILTEGDGPDRHVVGIVALRAADRTEENPLGIALFVGGVIVLAACGPGELSRDSIYPNGCFGSLELALEAG